MESKGTTAIKCVFVGDGSVGKTSLLLTLSTGKFPDYGKEAVESYTAEFAYEGKNVNLGLVDTSHDELNDRTRPLAYPDTDVFVLCFSPARHGSLLNVKFRWAKEVIHHCPDKPIILLALQTDRRTDQATIEMFDRARQGSIITTEEGKNMANEIGAEKYLECSAMTSKEDLQELLKALVEVGINGKKNKTKPKTGTKNSKKTTSRECTVM